MGSGVKKDRYAHKLNYSLKRRFFDSDGNPTEWQDEGFGHIGEMDRRTVCDIKTVQKQIDILARTNKKVEIEFIHDKQKKDYYGYPTKQPTVFNLGSDTPNGGFQELCP